MPRARSGSKKKTGGQKKDSRKGNPNIIRAAEKATQASLQARKGKKRLDYARIILKCWEAAKKNERIPFQSLFHRQVKQDGDTRGSMTGIRGYGSIKGMLATLERMGWIKLETDGQKFYILTFRAQRELERRSENREITRAEDIGPITSLKPDEESRTTRLIGTRLRQNN